MLCFLLEYYTFSSSNMLLLIPKKRKRVWWNCACSVSFLINTFSISSIAIPWPKEEKFCGVSLPLFFDFSMLFIMSSFLAVQHVSKEYCTLV